MKSFYIGLRFVGALVLVVFAVGCATGQTARESTLARAGFHNVTAATPQQKALLGQLASNAISRVRKDGAIWYVFPNQATSSAMVGSQAEFNEYLVLSRAQQMQTLTVSTVPIAAWSGFGGPAWGWRTQATRIPGSPTSSQTRN